MLVLLHHVFMCHTKKCIVGSMPGTHCTLLRAVHSTYRVGGACMSGANSVTISTFDIGKQDLDPLWSAVPSSKQQPYGHLRGCIISLQSHKKV